MKLCYRDVTVGLAGLVLAGVLLGAPAQATQHAAMSMPDTPAHFKPKLTVYTTNHAFLVKLTELPKPIPYQKYFTIKISVYDGHDPARALPEAKLALFAGMRHQLKHGFAHGMQSSPKITDKHGIFTVDGMFFHMMGKWTLKATVSDNGRHGIAYFNLPCCGD